MKRIKIENQSSSPDSFFQVDTKNQAFDALLMHTLHAKRDIYKDDVKVEDQHKVAARQILKDNPDLLLQKHVGDMKSPDYSSRTLKNFSAFQLTLWVGNRDMWEMMLSVIPKGQETLYYNELLQQYDDLMKNGLQYTLGNVTLSGLRIIQNTPTQQEQDHAKNSNAYHLIIKAGSYSLGFYDQMAKKYVQKPLTDNSPLKQHFNINGVKPDTDNVICDSAILELAATEFKNMGALNCCESRFNLSPQIDAIETYMNNCDDGWNWVASKNYWSDIKEPLDRFLPLHILSEYLGIHHFSDNFGYKTSNCDSKPEAKKAFEKLSKINTDIKSSLEKFRVELSNPPQPEDTSAQVVSNV